MAGVRSVRRRARSCNFLHACSVERCMIASALRQARALACVVIVLASPVAARAATGDADAVEALSAAQRASAQRVADWEAALDARLVGASEPDAVWLRGWRTRTDPDARARDFASAHRAQPREPVMLASLVGACMEPALPRPAACDESDWLAKWASVDSENAMPWMLLAARAVRIGQVERGVATLEQAAGKTRISDYATRAPRIAWNVVKRSADARDAGPASAATLAMIHSAAPPSDASLALDAACGELGTLGTRDVRAACARLADTAMRTSNTLAGRAFAAAMAVRLAADAPARTDAEAVRAQVAVQRTRCGQSSTTLEDALQSERPALRSAAIGAFEQWVVDLADSDEATACDRQAERIAKLPR